MLRPDGGGLSAVVELGLPEFERLRDGEVERIVLIGRWNISALQQPAPAFPADVDACAVAERGAGNGEELAAETRWTSGAEDLGVVPVEFRLPRPRDARARPIVWTTRPRP